jgi:hypothetical protein
MEGVNEIPVTAEPRIVTATMAVAQTLSNEPYACIGGAACQFLGSGRITQDVDFVVPPNMRPRIRKILSQSTLFHVAPDLRVSYVGTPGAEVAVDVLVPKRGFPERYDETTPTVSVAGVRVLHPVLILNAKYMSTQQCSDDEKAFFDVQDIAFMLNLIHDHPQPWGGAALPVSRATVLRATPLFLKELVKEHPDLAPAWERVGYNFTTGKPSPSKLLLQITGGLV